MTDTPNELIVDLIDANVRGVSPSQDWTHRAIETIQSLQQQLDEALTTIKRLNEDSTNEFNTGYKAAVNDIYEFTQQFDTDAETILEQFGG